MRHGVAEDHASTGRDEDRALTASGRAGVRDVAMLLAREGEMPRRILASPLVRAAQTAEIVAATAKAAGWDGAVETVRDLSPGRPTRRVVDGLRDSGADVADGALIVGHEPDLSGLVQALLGDPFDLGMDKAMVVAFELEAPPGSGATLRFIVDPRTVSLIRDQR